MRKIIAIYILFLLIVSIPALGQVTITNVFVSASTATTATINWTTSGPSTSQILYGFDPSLPFSSPVDRTMVTAHSMTLIVLDATRPYNFAVVSVDGAGHVTQSPTEIFALCGQPFNPASGTVNNYYQYGTFTLTWVPPSGSAATPTVCGQSMSTTLTGTLSGGASWSASVADSYKVVPGPGTWNIAVRDAGNIAPITITYPLSAQGNDVSQQLQIAASAAGLTAVIANLINQAVYPPFICTATNGVCPGGTGSPPAGVFRDVQSNGGGSPAVFAADSGNFQVNSTTHNVIEKQVNFIPYAGQFCSPVGCGTPNGIANAIGSTPNQSIFVATDDNNDPIQFSTVTGTQINRFTTDGSAGTWMTNPTYGTISQYFDPFFEHNSKTFGLVDTIPQADSFGTAHSVLEMFDYCAGPGWNVSSPFGVTTGLGWKGCANLNISSVQHREGLDATLVVGSDMSATGDQNVFSIFANYDALATAAATEGVTPFALHAIQHDFAAGPITATTGKGDTAPVFTNAHSAGTVQVGGTLIDVTAPNVAFTINSSGNLNRTSVIGTSILTNGSGQTDGVYTINATGGGGTGAVAQVGIGGGICGSAGIITPGVNYTSAPSFIVSAGGTPCSVVGLTFTYINVMNTSGASFTPNTGDGITNADIPAAPVAGTPVANTVSMSLQNHHAFTCWDGSHAGTCPTPPAGTPPSFIYLVSDAMQEKVPITAAGPPSSDLQSVTFLSQYPHPKFSSGFEGGTNGCFSSDLDAAPVSSGGINWFQCYTAFGAADAHTLLYGFEVEGSLKPVPIGNGSEPFSFSSVNGANAAHVYQQARVDKFDISNNWSLVPNDVPWTVGDTVGAMQVPSMVLHGMSIDLTQNRSPASNDGSFGINIAFGGPMVTQNFLPFGMVNSNPASMYTSSGAPFAWALAPDFIQLTGPMRSALLVNSNPFEAVVKLTQYLNTSPDLTLFETGTNAGQLFASPTNGYLGVTAGLFVGSSQIIGNNLNVGGSGVFVGSLTSPLMNAKTFRQSAGVFTNGTLDIISANPTTTDMYTTFSACTTAACTPADYISNGSLSSGKMTAGDIFVGARPNAITGLFPQGTTGSTTYTYFVTQVTANGETAPSANVTLSNGNATLGATGGSCTSGPCQIVLLGQQTEGATAVNFYRATTVGPYTAGLICANVTFFAPLQQCTDAGQAPSAGLPPAQGNSGKEVIDGSLAFTSTSGVVTGIQGTDTNLLSAGTVSGSAGTPLCVDGLLGATTVGCSAPVIAFFTTTTTAASDTITVTGVTSSSHCALFPNNASAGTMIQNAVPTYADTYAAGSFVLHHVTGVAGAVFSGLCTAY